MTDNKPSPNAESTSAEVPGMKEALATLKREHWPANPAPFQRFMQQADWYVSSKYASLFRKIEKAALVVKNPSALLTDLPFIARTRLALALDEMRAVPEGAALADMTKDGLQVRIDNKLDSAGLSIPGTPIGKADVTEFEPGTVEVSGISTKGMLVLVLAHEMQHQRQIMAGLLNPYNQHKMPSPVEAVWYNRAIEADAHATAVDIAWKLKEEGKPAAWEHARYVDRCKEMAQKYEEEALRDPASVADGRAKRAAFDHWFVQKQTLSMGLTTSQSYNSGAMSNIPSAAVAFEWAKKGIKVQPLTAADFEKLGDLSDTNYLKIPGSRNLDDPYYRRPDWNIAEAGYLAARQKEYDQIADEYGRKYAPEPPTVADKPRQESVAENKAAPAAKGPGPMPSIKIWS